jgi:serine acetyltransferase
MGANISNDISIGSGSTISANVFVSRDLESTSFINFSGRDGNQN